MLAELDGELLGTVMGGFDGRRGLMYQLAVNPEHRRQGNAIRLVDVLEDRLRTKGGFCYYLLFTKDNEAALKISRSSDFSRSLRLKPFLQKNFRVGAKNISIGQKLL